MFSNAARVYESEEEVAAAWEAYRTQRSAGNPRLAAMLARINELEHKLSAPHVAQVAPDLFPQ